jgi:hypothetical protein
MTDILRDLRRASWRELEFPVIAREFGFQHEQQEVRYLFRDLQLVESLGRKNPTYRYTIPFREDIARGPWRNLFTIVYPQFLAACLDRTRDSLVDPVHGGVPAKCVSLRELLTVGKRDGIDVEAEFIHAPAESEFATVAAQIRGIEGARGMAGALDREITKIPFRQELPPEPTISPLDAVSSVTSQVEVGVNRVAASFGDAAFRIEKATDSIKRLKDPANQPVLQQAARLRNALLDFEETVDPIGARPLRRITNTVDRPISALAALLGMTVQELVRLNPTLARSPAVRAGASLRIFATALKSNGRAA